MLRLFLFALLFGALAVAGFAPLSVFPLSIIGLAGLVYLLSRIQGALKGFMLGWGWGLGFFLCGVSWLYIALNRYGGVPMPLAGLAIFLFCAYLALFPALVCALHIRLRGQNAGCSSLLFAGLWTLSELLRGWLFTGFPWLAIGYTQAGAGPLAGALPILGVYGVGWLLAFIAALLVLTSWRVAADRTRSLLGLVVILAAGMALSKVSWTTPTASPLSVALVQTNIGQNLKWAPEQLDHWLEVNARLVNEQHASLVVLPETTLPLLEEKLPAGYLDFLSAPVQMRQGNLVFGVFVRDADGRIYNAALSRGSSPAQRYNKQHLVPFGEYSPPLFDWFYRFADIPMSNQTPGAQQQAPLVLGQQRVAINICYEDLFGRELIKTLPEATLMLNLSNLAWYGDSWAQPQHLQIARARALETGRPMLRATNTGMTAVIMPDGTVSEVLPAFTQGVLQAEVRGYQGTTPYARWGDWAALLLVVLGITAGWRVRKNPVQQ